MITGAITSKAQTTLPLAVRRALRVGPGDRIAYEIDGERVVVRRAPQVSSDPFVNNFSAFTEWAEEADSAYDVLSAR